MPYSRVTKVGAAFVRSLQNRQQVSRPLLVGFLSLLVAAAAAAAVASIFWPSATYAITGLAACAVVTAPMIHARYQLLSPWTLFALVIYDSCGLRSLAVALGWNGHGPTNDQLFLLGHGPGYFWWPSFLYVAGLAACAIGFVLVLDRPFAAEVSGPGSATFRGLRSLTRLYRTVAGQLRRTWQRYQFRSWTPYAVLALAAAGLLGFMLFVEATGGLSASSLSAKRSYNAGVNVAAGYSSHGSYRLVGFFAVVAFWIYLAHLLRERTARWRSPRTAVALLLLVNAALLPVYNSQRTDLGVIFLVALAIFFALRRDPRQRWRIAQWLLAVAVIAFVGMTMARFQSQHSDLASVSASNMFGSLGDVVIWNQNHGDMFTASHIMHALPERLHYAHGETITTWFAAPVPRTIWPSKPLISPGPEIGQVIYGNGRSGVPPGLVGEMYWNFGVAGVFLGCLTVGLILGGMSRWRKPVADWSAATMLLVCALVVPFGFFILEEGLGGAIFQTAFNGVPLLIGLAACGTWRAGRASAVRSPTRTLPPHRSASVSARLDPAGA